MICSKIFKFFSLFGFLLIFSFGVMAQQQLPAAPQEIKEDFTDEELENFVKINLEVIPIQQEAEGQMIEAISEKGLDVQRFQELAQAQQTGKITDASQDPEELAKFNEAGQEVMKVQKEVQGEIQQKIMDSEMDIQKFQQISMAYNQSETVRTKIDKLLEENAPQ